MNLFEVRLQLVSILGKLSSSQDSIQSTIWFSLTQKDKYGEDLWDCLMEEAEKECMILLDSIDGLLLRLSTALLKSHQDYQYHKREQNRRMFWGRMGVSISQSLVPPSAAGLNLYGHLIKKDIIKFVETVVPTTFNKKGLLNLTSTLQVIKNWKPQVSLIEQFLKLVLLEQTDLLLNDR
ncbi:uncharacterized protein PGTG_16409 [Puccinia graminis f. sp. tritici CRL 75-36-700-3]|uniref:CTD kinase subunit gamma Ctk3 N-terminal domain-containing protein n=1 Tax=Puccinia graminis f. sp. tritici (strain CRL 75-36-700-3 / race SCCL) TaxID=418459 RepID=E3L3U3_PUCGT|nr:uncharacterized protein PGTG_16409 [Puccinia graminis f. sp. tritici CRL 75-36-700-3]EFP91218.1 hypothetical protein PGTG_16409 [Puccinia graminis f. sp. tritici CRL 75-36-700-3]